MAVPTMAFWTVNGNLQTIWLRQNESGFFWIPTPYNNGGGDFYYWEPCPEYLGGQVPFGGPLIQANWLPITNYAANDAANSNPQISFVRYITNTSTWTDGQGGATYLYMYLSI